MPVKLDNHTIPAEDKKDIIELEKRISGFKSGEEDEERFKLYRLTRGVYGQRQLGVQMFRIKIPYGSLTCDQLVAIADTSDRYASSNLHLTTRQDIQLHYVKLEDSPKVWVDLTTAGLTGREACGNTVRNLTCSDKAGIDPEEPFDVTPYAHAVAYYFLRNPICQEMGRKIKPAFSSSIKDSAFTWFHDFGFIQLIQDGERGFKVVIGGGLGAQAIEAKVAYEFLAADKIIPFMEAGLRVFDRHGEREKRGKARMKFLVKKLGLDGYMDLIKEEWKALKNKKYPIDPSSLTPAKPLEYFTPQVTEAKNKDKFELWLKTNTFEQKQKGFYGVYSRVLLGDISSDNARLLASVIKKYAADDIRVTVNQGLLYRHLHKDHLAAFFNELDEIGFAEPGFDSIADVTACPGTDTCNLGVTNSTGLSRVIEKFIEDEFAHLLADNHIKIKISGCMNACGQHTAANIGFHGSSIKKDGLVIPAMQVLLGGGIDWDGKGWIADKVIKLPTKKIIDAIRLVLNDYESNTTEGEYFNVYYTRLGKKYFYTLLKPLADISNLDGTDYFDWEQDHQYKQEIGVGECAGVILDVVGTIIKDASEKLEHAKEGFNAGVYADCIYYAYATYVVSAKALLLSEDIKCNTQAGIIKDFKEQMVDTSKFAFEGDFSEAVLRINKNEPSKEFAQKYIDDAEEFLKHVIKHREASLKQNGKDKQVIDSYYKA